ncbi:MAG: preprotein translocase subunit YajC [Cytophagales bacterium]|nr:MAG: preprotein translocase subunit YajC [Cytophagales bacterium]TAF61557.1 MAG: preprotein translocase subunit YajC [Cytophagales bacterium]
MLLHILLQAAGTNYMQFAILGGIFVIMYFFMIRPQQQKQKEQKGFLSQLKKDDLVVTAGGIHGRITFIYEDDSIQLEIDKGVRVRVERAFISYENSKNLQPKSPEKQESKTGAAQGS